MYALLFVRHLDSECQVLLLTNDIDVCDGLCRCSTAESVICLSELAFEDTPDVAEYLMQCVCSDQLNIQLKGVREPRTIEHMKHMCNIVPPKCIKRLRGSSGSMFVACCCPWAG